MEAAVAHLEPLRVMLVDDDDIVNDAVSAILTAKGWAVATFDNAVTASEELRHSLDRYDVLVTDINMPGLSGIDFLKVARESSPDIPVVMITGYPSIDIAVEAMKHGANDFLTKPFSSTDLVGALNKAVNAREHRHSHLSAVDASEPTHRIDATMPDPARRRLEEKIKELSIMHTINESIDEAVDKDDVFRKTMDLGQIITDAEQAFVMAVEAEKNSLVVRAVSGYADTASVMGARFGLGEEPFRSVIKNKCYSSLMVDSSAELQPLVTSGESAFKRAPLTLAPLLINREVVVLLGLTGSDPSVEISHESLGLLLNLLAKASLKLENITLTENIFSNIIGAINSLINALDARDTYTKDHSNRVTQYALKIARSYNSTQEVLDSISFAGPLHDVGKIGVRDDVLLKKGSFSPDERVMMMSHVVRGEEILRPLNLLDSEKSVILYHHERWDGKGYPNGLVREQIPIAARIFSVADTYDAMTSSRPYRDALSTNVAIEEITGCSGTQFDPEVVTAFMKSGILETNL
ncbi:MAG: response regulator [Proteobacteria bacterium]|nr:response regulator [Pseudomonadota bacterium]